MTIPYKRSVLCQATHKNLPQIWHKLDKEAEMYPSIMQKGFINYKTIINTGFDKITTHYITIPPKDDTHKTTSPVCRNTYIIWLFTPSYSFPEDTILFICLLTHPLSEGCTSEGEVPFGWPQHVNGSSTGHTDGLFPVDSTQGHQCLFPLPWRGRQPSSTNGPSYKYTRSC